MCKALDLSEKLFDVTEEIKKEWKKLHRQLEIEQQKRTDVNHYIEFHNLNAAQGYEAYKLLQEILKSRKEIKDKIEEMKPIIEFVNSNPISNPNKHNSINNKINKINDKNKRSYETKKYRVRVMTGIFGNTMKNKTLSIAE